MKESTGRKIYRQYGIYILFVVLFAILSFSGEGFLSVNNMTNIMRQVAVYAILGFGMTFVMISGRIDLSVGSVLALSGCVAALCMVKLRLPMPVAVVMGLLTGCACGFVNGFCIAKLKVPFFITTAGMMYAASGIALVITKENPVTGLPTSFNIFGGVKIGIVPSQFIIAAIFFVICYVVLNHTKMGRYTYAIGSNQRTAKLSGINVDKYVILIYTLNGLAAALAGIVTASRLQIGSPLISNSGYEIYAVAAAAIGGTSLSGGEGSLPKTVVGALILTIIGIGLNILKISQSNQKIIIGVIMVAVVALDMWDKRKQQD